MLGIGFTEIVVIGIFALVVMGPEKFPEFAKVVIRTMRDLRGYWEEMQDEVEKELRPIKRDLDEVNRMRKRPLLPAKEKSSYKPNPTSEDAPTSVEEPGYDESMEVDDVPPEIIDDQDEPQTAPPDVPPEPYTAESEHGGGDEAPAAEPSPFDVDAPEPMDRTS